MRSYTIINKPVSNTTLGGHAALPLITKLQDLITAGPVPRGFYVATGGRDLADQVQERLVDLLWKYSVRHAGETNADEGVSFSHVGRRPSQIGQLIWVDSGNIFDPYHMSTLARQRGMNPARVLRAVKVGRPFTAFQFQQMLERIPNPALWAYPEGEGMPQAELPSAFSREVAALDENAVVDVRAPNAVWWTPLVVISDLMGLFYDPELPEDDLYRAFREFLTRLAHLRDRAIVLALLHDHVVPPARRHLLQEVLRLSRLPMIQLKEGGAHGTHIAHASPTAA